MVLYVYMYSIILTICIRTPLARDHPAAAGILAARDPTQIQTRAFPHTGVMQARFFLCLCHDHDARRKGWPHSHTAHSVQACAGAAESLHTYTYTYRRPQTAQTTYIDRDVRDVRHQYQYHLIYSYSQCRRVRVNPGPYS